MYFSDLKYLHAIVIENRSLAENNPLNLARIDTAAKSYLKELGEKEFIALVWDILDATE